MRLDVFLRNSRLIKRRSLAQTACRSSRIIINGKPAKPATDVREGDEITIVSPTWRMRVKVLCLPSRPGGGDVIEVLEQERVEEG
ncbi:MAG TPA: S4 domain-containing protein [Atribacteraceae bacterium]|nr:S4 domain-containing protein [Atribacteraceae bacterium]